jgi:hypothetical protein
MAGPLKTVRRIFCVARIPNISPGGALRVLRLRARGKFKQRVDESGRALDSGASF